MNSRGTTLIAKVCYACVVVALLQTAGCRAGVALSMAYSDPVVLEESEDKVKFRSGIKVDPDSFAEEYCEDLVKRPLKLSQAKEGNFIYVWRYACLADHPQVSSSAFGAGEMRAIASHYTVHNREDLAGYYLCLAAHDGDAEAQWRYGSLYERGAGGYPTDLEQAYQWYRLSNLNGWSNTESIEALSAAMSPESIERAKHSAATWQPDRTKCVYSGQGVLGALNGLGRADANSG